MIEVLTALENFAESAAKVAEQLSQASVFGNDDADKLAHDAQELKNAVKAEKEKLVIANRKAGESYS